MRFSSLFSSLIQFFNSGLFDVGTTTEKQILALFELMRTVSELFKMTQCVIHNGTNDVTETKVHVNALMVFLLDHIFKLLTFSSNASFISADSC